MGIQYQWHIPCTNISYRPGNTTYIILYQKEIVIGEEDTYESLEHSLMKLGGETIVEALTLLEQGKLTATPQDDEKSNYAPLIKKEMGRIDFNRDAFALDRQIRGMNPWPSAYTTWRGKQLKLWQAGPKETEKLGAPGEVIKVSKDHFTVATGRGVLDIWEVQLEGKKRMSSRDFLLGVQLKPGDVLGAN